MAEQAGEEDFGAAYRRARRTVRHLWSIHCGVTEYSPNGCDGCKEIHHFLTEPKYRGDAHYPVWDRLDDHDWALGPDDMELNEGIIL
jgi:hypothetical protein